MHTLLAQSQLNAQNQGIKGCDRPSNQRDLVMIGMNSFAYVQQVLSPFEMNNSKDHISTKFMHRNLYEILPS